MTSDRPAAWVDTLLEIWRVGQDRSMVGPGDPRVHLDRALAVAAAVDDPPGRALDLGSGAGIPGLALAGHWPDSTWVLLDAANRRVEVLRDGVARLRWEERVSVVHGRAEELGHDPGHRQGYDLVTSRSFGPPAVTAECGGAFVRVGGILVVTEPPAGDDRWPVDGLDQLGLVAERRTGGVQVLRRIRDLDPRFPRRSGIPAKRPLF